MGLCELWVGPVAGRNGIRQRLPHGEFAIPGSVPSRLGGRPPITGTNPRLQAAKRLNQDRSLGIDEICETLRISRSTFYRYLALADGVK